jgi:hypothetical protein
MPSVPQAFGAASDLQPIEREDLLGSADRGRHEGYQVGIRDDLLLFGDGLEATEGPIQVLVP